MGARSSRGDYDVRRDPADDPDDPSFRAPRNRSKAKDRKRWCRGKHGVEHQPETRLYKGVDCREWPQAYLCFHEIRCIECGKRLGFVKPADCPDRKKDDQ